MKPRTIMSEEPIKELESRVLEERNRLHDTAGALKDKIAETRATLSVVGQVKKHFITAFLGVSLHWLFKSSTMGPKPWGWAG